MAESMSAAEGVGTMGGADGPLVLAVDQGTSATKAVLVDVRGDIVALGSAPVALSTPAPGWVEQSAEEIWQSCRRAVAQCLDGQDATRVAAVGLSTQRESLLLWERATGTPLSPLVSWLDKRTAGDPALLRALDSADLVRDISGLPLDPMFSAPKAAWLLDHHDPERRRSRAGELCLGTVDSWLLFKLGGAHLIEVGNAARTQLFDVHRLTWDERLMRLFDVPPGVLPRVVSSQGPFPPARDLAPLPDGVPVTAVLGDSHAALFAHAGWQDGTVKATYGTGSSVMAVAPSSTRPSSGMCLTVAWDVGEPAWAVEGNIRSTGATLTWLAKLLGTDVSALASLAADSSDGVVIVPAFGGLGAPWWDDEAVGLISGVTFGTEAPQLVRAALESIAFQVEDVVAAVERDIGPVVRLLTDGGPTGNPLLMQLQADTSGRVVERARARDLSALGAAHLAGLGGGVWSKADLERLHRPRDVYTPDENPDSRAARRAHWHAAVRRSRRRASDDEGISHAVATAEPHAVLGVGTPPAPSRKRPLVGTGATRHDPAPGPRPHPSDIGDGS
ncbi:glycerol kinase [Streptomyces sp. LBL]|uniref:FGGY-family carbohydrate kinase n=1 Tax=Streptomyces sp. LBL TaxID=2940562 RepID=UPI00247722A3|nr:FGGY family carbohydrate kinase [Streptomyces sp. LBL]MDH6629151.1 glycerol kinase [Streptomyces sp. LBL]